MNILKTSIQVLKQISKTTLNSGVKTQYILQYFEQKIFWCNEKATLSSESLLIK